MSTRKEIEWITNEKGCHLVTSHRKDKSGYVLIDRDGKTKRLHRFIYEQHHGKLDEGIVVRHKCDNPSCINIEHLESGTHTDNMRDKFERGRGSTPYSVGESNGYAKLNEEQVIEILNDKESTNKALASKYNVHHATISAIRLRKIWKHVGIV